RACNCGPLMRAADATAPTVAWLVEADGRLRRMSADALGWDEPAGPAGQALRDVAAASRDEVWAISSEGDLFRTGDGGATWALVQRRPGHAFSAIARRGGRTWIVGVGEAIYRSGADG